MLKLKPLKKVPKAEPPSIFLDDKLVHASRFGQMEFQAVLQHIALLSRREIVRVMNAYADAKMIFGYGETQKRTSGERTFEHVKGAALIDILEFGNKDPDITIAELHHDSREDSLLFQGNENHPRRRPSHLLIDSFERFADRYGERVAKIIECLTKPQKPARMDELQKKAYCHAALGRIVSLHPDVRKEAAQGKTCDAMHNNRTENGSQERLEKQTLEKAEFYLPIACFAGDLYYQRFRTELKDKLLQLGLVMPKEHDYRIG